MNFCPFCEHEKERIIFKNKLSFALLDIYPVTKGHTLIIPKRHILNLEDLKEEEILDIFESYKKVKVGLEIFLKPEGFNFGVNLGVEAGQSIEHIHFHLIPRYKGDTKFPYGGIRKVTMDFIDFNVKNLKEEWIKNRLNEEKVLKIKEIIKNS